MLAGLTLCTLPMKEMLPGSFVLGGALGPLALGTLATGFEPGLMLYEP